MSQSSKIVKTGFGNQLIEIGCKGNGVYSLVKSLFLDLPTIQDPISTKQYSVQSNEENTSLIVRQGDKELYRGKSLYRCAYVLMNEVIYHAINKNRVQHAIHSGAVYNETCCILLPGASGNGKSTLTTWLVSRGFKYLTDELSFISNDCKVSPFTRPINLKVRQSTLSWLPEIVYSTEVISDHNGTIIPHRLLNPSFSSVTPQVTHIIFPNFSAGISPKISHISPAKSCLHLLESHVNARNLPAHGIADLSSIVRTCKSFHLSYGKFVDLEDIFMSDNDPLGLKEI